MAIVNRKPMGTTPPARRPRLTRTAAITVARRPCAVAIIVTESIHVQAARAGQIPTAHLRRTAILAAVHQEAASVAVLQAAEAVVAVVHHAEAVAVPVVAADEDNHSRLSVEPYSLFVKILFFRF